MKRIFTAFLALACLSSATSLKPKKLSPDLVKNLGGTTRVIIHWSGPVGAATQSLMSLISGTAVNEFTALNQGVYTIPNVALDVLSSSPLVQYITPDRTLNRKLAFASAAINAPAVWQSGYNGAGIGVAILDSGVNANPNLGQGATSSIVYTQDFTVSLSSLILKTDLAVAGYGQDWYGHGQHVAGIIASNGKDSICKNCTQSMVGIAPGAKLIDLKVLDEFGNGSDSQVIAAINQAILLKNVYNIRVLNLSLGRPVVESYTQDPLCQAVEAAWKAGITVVVAAGNEGRDNSSGNHGYGTITAPGNDPYVITVGSMKAEGTPNRSDDLVASYSSKGPTAIDYVVKPDIMAPGNQVISLMALNGTMPLTTPQNAVPLAAYQNVAQPTNAAKAGTLPANSNQQPPAVNYGGGYSKTYFTLSGTSMAAAVVSGGVADLLQAYPKLTPDQVKALIMTTAYQGFPVSSSVMDPATGNTYTDYYDVFTVGAGYLDLQAALLAAPQALTLTGTAVSPVASLDNSGNLVMTPDSSSVWPTQTLTNHRSVWTTSANSASRSLWSTDSDSANRSLWSTSSDTANRSLWSTSTDTANRSLWTTSSDSAESVAINGEP